MAIVNSAAMNTQVHVSFLMGVLSAYVPRLGLLGEKGTLLHHWWECKLVQPLWRTVWRYLRNLYIELPYDPTIPLLGIYLDKTYLEKDTCTPMFIAALFTIAKTWKQPKCPSTDDWIRKM